MLNHVIVGSNDIERSKRFYDAVLAVLGARAGSPNRADSGHLRYFYRHGGHVFGITEPIDGEPATVANGNTIGFHCTSPEQVRELHDVAIAHGGTSIENPPGLRNNSVGAVHLSYFRDPDGHKLCGMHRL